MGSLGFSPFLPERSPLGMMEPGFRFRCSFNFHKASSEISRFGGSGPAPDRQKFEKFSGNENLPEQLGLWGRCFADKESRRHRCGLALHMAKNRAVLVSSAVSEEALRPASTLLLRGGHSHGPLFLRCRAGWRCLTYETFSTARR